MKLFGKKSQRKTRKGSRRIFLVIVLLGALGVLLYQFVFLPVWNYQKKVTEDLNMKKKALARYQEFVRSGKGIEEELHQLTKRLEAIQSQLLPGETPQIMAANLQEVLKKLSERNGILIKSFRVAEPKEMAFYVRIPVTIEISPTKSAASLAYFLYDIEHYEKALFISDLDITAPNMRHPNEVQGSLTVMGIAKNLHPKGPKGKEG